MDLLTASLLDLLRELEPVACFGTSDTVERIEAGSVSTGAAVDWIHPSINTTIKSLKFSHLAPVCGGPIEVTVITTDRTFRWVRHKELDSALGDNQAGGVKMERKKNKRKTGHAGIYLSDLHISAEPAPVVEIVRFYQRTGGFRRKDLRRVLGDEMKGVSAGEKGLEELLSGK
jgi:hypothetical protein